MSGVSKCVGWVLVLLALAHPHAAGRVLAVLDVAGGFLLAHLTTTCVLVAVVLLARVALRIHRRRRMLLRRLRPGARW